MQSEQSTRTAQIFLVWPVCSALTETSTEFPKEAPKVTSGTFCNQKELNWPSDVFSLNLPHQHHIKPNKGRSLKTLQNHSFKVCVLLAGGSLLAKEIFVQFLACLQQTNPTRNEKQMQQDDTQFSLSTRTAEAMAGSRKLHPQTRAESATTWTKKCQPDSLQLLNFSSLAVQSWANLSASSLLLHLCNGHNDTLQHCWEG